MLLLAGCGSDGSEVGTETASSVADNADDSQSSTTIEPEPSATSSTTSEPEPSVLDQSVRSPEEAEAVEACSGDAYSGPSPPPPDAYVHLTDEAGNGLCLGPVQLTGEALESATSVASEFGEHRVELVFTTDGIEGFNDLAAECLAEGSYSALCPSGRVAIVVDSVVVSSPSIQGAPFERDQIVVSGAFSKEEADDLTARIVSGSIRFRPVVVDLGSFPSLVDDE